MHPLTGYADRWGARAGEKIRFHIASAGDRPFELSFRRIFCADPNPDGPGYRDQAMPTPLDGPHKGLAQGAWPGSYAGATMTLPAGALALSATIWPTTPDKGAQGIFSLAVGGITLALGIDAFFTDDPALGRRAVDAEH